TGPTMSITELSPAPASRGRETPRPVLWAAAVGCLALAHLPLLVAHAQQIWLRPHYQFFPLVLVGAAVLLVTRVRNLGDLPPPPTLGAPRPPAAARGALCSAGAGGARAAPGLLHSSGRGGGAAALPAPAALFAAGGARLLRAGAPALLLLCVAIPPPFELDRT